MSFFVLPCSNLQGCNGTGNLTSLVSALEYILDSAPPASVVTASLGVNAVRKTLGLFLHLWNAACPLPAPYLSSAHRFVNPAPSEPSSLNTYTFLLHPRRTRWR